MFIVPAVEFFGLSFYSQQENTHREFFVQVGLQDRWL